MLDGKGRKIRSERKKKKKWRKIGFLEFEDNRAPIAGCAQSNFPYTPLSRLHFNPVLRRRLYIIISDRATVAKCVARVAAVTTPYPS